MVEVRLALKDPNNSTMQDPVYLDLDTCGLLWACGKLDENGKPLPGCETKKK